MDGNAGPQNGNADDGEESWDEDDDASSFHDDDSSSDGDDEGADDHHILAGAGVAAASSNRVVKVPCPGPSTAASGIVTAIPQVHQSGPSSATASAAAIREKELEWDHSSM